MILQKLCEYYDRLADDPNVALPRPGFTQQNISYEVVLEVDGTLHDIVDIRDTTGRSPRPKSMPVPGGAKPSGSGINANFIWDRTDYMLGFKADDEKPDRTAKAFEAFRQRHLDAEPHINSPPYKALCTFLRSWSVDRAEQYPALADVSGMFGVFRLRGEQRYFHEDSAIQTFALRAQTDDSDTPAGQCLVTGQTEPIARLHEPKIKGVVGANTAGAPIVSFNFDATESYGKQSSYNAPVGESVAFKYCTALNYLLARDSAQKVLIGGDTVVCWTDKPTPFETMFGQIVNGGVEDEGQREKVIHLLKAIVAGGSAADLGPADTKFYILGLSGLSPNVGRVSVRFWHQSTVGQMQKQLAEHHRELAITHSQYDSDILFLWQLLRETARESKDIPPLLAGAMMRAVLTGQNYPDAMYHAIGRRIQADRNINYARAAFIKAYLTRNHHKEITVSLNPDRPEPAYQLGRLFAVLEKSQQDALGKSLNATIKDRYFGAASSTPASVFPRLIRLNQHHMRKLEGGIRVISEKRMQAIVDRIDCFPAHLNMTDQGLFALGYYHQRQDLFTKRSDSDTDTPETQEISE